MFACRQVADGEAYLYVDYRIRCYSREHNSYRALAAFWCARFQTLCDSHIPAPLSLEFRPCT